MMKKIKLLILLLPIFLFTGCYNYRELNQLAITSAVGIDLTDDGLYRVTIQVLNTKKNDKDSNASEVPEFVVYSSDAKTLQEAFRKIILDSSKRIYANHLQVLLIGDKLAKSGIKDIMDMFFRNSESRKQFLVLVAKDQKAENILSILTPQENLSSKNIKDSLTIDSIFLGVGQLITFEEMVDNYINDNKEISLPTVELRGPVDYGEQTENIEQTSSETRLVSGPTAIFKDDVLIDYLTLKESIMLNFVNDRIKNTVVSYECGENKYVVAELLNTKSSLDIATDPLKAKLTVKAHSNINEITCNLNLQDDDVIKEIEDNVKQKLEDDITSTMKKIINEYNTDVFGIRDTLYKNNPKYYKQIKDEWYDKYFRDMEIDVNVDLQLLEKGNALRVIER